MARVLALFAHPDDEAYSCAGLLARMQRRGHTVQVVVASAGEGGRHRSAAIHGAALGELRLAELQSSCDHLGLASPRCLGLPDGRVDADAVLEALEREFGNERVDHLLGLDDDGAYGHRDHLACVSALRRFTHHRPHHQVAFPTDLWAPVHRRLGPFVVPRRDLPFLGRPPDQLLTVDVDPELKLGAIACHASQLMGGDPRSFLRPGFVDPLLTREWLVDTPSSRELVARL